MVEVSDDLCFFSQGGDKKGQYMADRYYSQKSKAKPFFRRGRFLYSLSDAPRVSLSGIKRFMDRLKTRSQAMSDYISWSFVSLNESLMEGGDIPEDMGEDFFPSPYNMYVYRGTDARFLSSTDGKQRRILSTSLSMGVAIFFASGGVSKVNDPLLIQIRIPKGAPVGVGEERQDEIVLPPGVVLRGLDLLEDVEIEEKPGKMYTVALLEVSDW